MKNISNFKIFETNILDGPMQLKYEYFSPDTGGIFKRKVTDFMSQEMKDEFLSLRIDAGIKYGFDGKKVIVPCEAYGKYKNGHYFVADSDVYNMDDDLWNVDIPGDVAILKKDNPGIAIAYPVSDDPVVIAYDPVNEACALSHCDLKKISKEMPNFVVDALVKEIGSDASDLKVYISSNLKKESNHFFMKPDCIESNRKVFKGCIKKGAMKINNNSGLGTKALLKLLNCFVFSVDQEKAIYNMLVKKGVDPSNITISKYDTYKDPLFFSSQFENKHKVDCKSGKFLVGAYFDDTFPSYDGSYYVRTL